MWQCSAFLQSLRPHVSCQTLKERHLCFTTQMENTRKQLPTLWLGHPLTFFLFPSTWTCLCGFQGDWTNTLAAYYDWLLSAITSIRCTVVFGSKDRLLSQGQTPWVKGQHIQFPAVRVAEAYDSTSAIQQCLLCSLTLIHPQELITNVSIYTYSFLAYSSLHILNVSPSCSFTVSSSVPASSPLQSSNQIH